MANIKCYKLIDKEKLSGGGVLFEKGMLYTSKEIHKGLRGYFEPAGSMSSEDLENQGRDTNDGEIEEV